MEIFDVTLPYTFTSLHSTDTDFGLVIETCYVLTALTRRDAAVTGRVDVRVNCAFYLQPIVKAKLNLLSTVDDSTKFNN